MSGKTNFIKQWIGAFVLSLFLTAPISSWAASKTITVLSTNDFHGALTGKVHSWSHGDMVGGAEWLAGYLNVVREENPDGVLQLDAGDMLQGTLISNYFDGASTIEVFNAMGLNAMAIGNHEFDWGLEVLKDRSKQADFPFLAANIYYADKKSDCQKTFGHGLRNDLFLQILNHRPQWAKPFHINIFNRPKWAKPFLIKKINGVKVGIIGLATPDTPSITNPAYTGDLVFADPVETVNFIAPILEKKGVNLIIVLAHIGGYWPDFEEGIKDLACGCDSEQVDLIVSGHTHSRIDDVICDIPVVQSYSGGTAFSRVDFEVNLETGEPVSYVMNSYPTTTFQTYYGGTASYKRWDTGEWQAVVPDPEVEAIVTYYEAEIEEIKNEVVGETTVAITRDYRHESVMGDWVTDIMRTYEYEPGIDFALTNSGGLRTDIDAGAMTFGEVYEALPFDNTLVVVELDGNEVRQVLEEGITGDHGVVQVSGLQFTFDYDQPAGSRIQGDIIDLNTGLPLDPDTVYNVAANDFMANGGDDYTTLAANLQTDSYVLVRDIVVSWTRNNSPFTPPNPADEQRITVLGTPPN